MPRLERRVSVPLWLEISAPVMAVVAAFALCSVLLIAIGAPVLQAYWLLFVGSFGNSFAISETLAKATPLIFTGLAAAVAFRASLYNIGGEGQLLMGGIMVVLIGTGFVALPPVLMVPLLLIAGALGGLALLIGPALLKVRLGVDEVVTTLLLNFIILLVLSYLLQGPLRDPDAFSWPQSRDLVDSGRLGRLVDAGRAHWGFAVAVAAVALTSIFMSRTVWGLELRAVGANPRGAAFAGISVDSVVIRTALISGGLAGLAGAVQVMGLRGNLTTDLSPGYGYLGIAVAMLGLLRPWGVLIAALFVAALFTGGGSMGRALNVPSYLADVIAATALLTVIASQLAVRYRVRWS